MSCGDAGPTLCCCFKHGSVFLGASTQYDPSTRLLAHPCVPGVVGRAVAAGAVRIRHGEAAPAAAALTCGTQQQHLPSPLLHCRGWRPGGRVSLCWLSLSREKKSSGPQLPCKAEAKALCRGTDLSSFHDSPLPAISLSPGSSCLLPKQGRWKGAGWGSFQASSPRKQHRCANPHSRAPLSVWNWLAAFETHLVKRADFSEAVR